MIKHETITVGGLVMYCDGCGQRGPETAYDNHNDLSDQAEQMGWSESQTDDDRVLCNECISKQKGKK